MILAELQVLTDGLTYMSESDYPYEIIDTTQPKITQATLNLLIQEELEEETRSLEDFFKNSTHIYEGMDENALAIAQKNQAFKDYFVKKCGEQVHIFRLGDAPEIDIYIVGRTPENEYIILKTKSIET